MKVDQDLKEEKGSAKGQTDVESTNVNSNAHPSTLSIEESESFMDSLKNEWKLFWHGLVGEDEDQQPKEEEPLPADKLQALTSVQYKQLMRVLSQDRRRLNLHIEKINSEIDTNSEYLRSLELVGGDPEETLEAINKLNDIGMQLSLQLKKVDDRLNHLRDFAPST